MCQTPPPPPSLPQVASLNPCLNLFIVRLLAYNNKSNLTILKKKEL